MHLFENIEVIGYAAALFTSLYLLPQVIKILQTNSVKDISLISTIVLAIGLSLWIIYGTMKDAPSVIVGNSITLVFTIYILFRILFRQDLKKKVT